MNVDLMDGDGDVGSIQIMFFVHVQSEEIAAQQFNFIN